MKLKPIDDRLLIEPAEAESTTAGGIIIPDTAKEKPMMGTVIEIGTDDEIKELFKIGDKVLFAKYGGEDITIDNKEYKIVQRTDILAKVED